MLIVPKPHSLLLPPIHNLQATPANNPATNGTTVAASASVNTKGSWVEIFAAATVAYDVFGITIFIANDVTTAASTRNLYDIGIGAAAAETVLVPNIMNAATTNLGNQPSPREIFIPIFVPKGTRIAMRKQSNIGSKTSSIAMFLHSGGGLPPWAVFTGCDSYATDTATSGGQAHTPGNSGTYSAWTNLGATLSRNYSAILPLIGVGSDAVMSQLTGYLDLGIDSVGFGKYMYLVSNLECIGAVIPNMPLYNRWPSGAQMMLRSTMSGTADDNYEFGFLALY